MPIMYLAFQLVARFLVEQPIIKSFVSLSMSFFWVWLTVRLFVVTSDKPEQVGDPSPAFALSTFAP